MSFAELIILDVGHGNCAVLKDKGGVVLIDCPPGSTLLEALELLEISEISHVLISHADKDHIAGLIPLLLNVRVNNVHLNSDWLRGTEVWKDVCLALKSARKSGVVLEVQLTTETTGRYDVGDVNVQILAPDPTLALIGVGGKDFSGRKINANSMSAVVSFVHNAHRVAILAGDLDQVGLNSLIEENPDLKADLLVFPHHGGKPGIGVNEKQFARQLCELIKPRCVVFSIDRSRYSNPQNEIVEGVLSVVPNAHIICTQLSEKCAATLPEEEPKHLTNLPAIGRKRRSCCGGTIRLILGKDANIYIPSPQSHQDFVAQYPDSICRQFPS